MYEYVLNDDRFMVFVVVCLAMAKKAARIDFTNVQCGSSDLLVVENCDGLGRNSSVNSAPYLSNRNKQDAVRLTAVSAAICRDRQTQGLLNSSIYGPGRSIKDFQSGNFEKFQSNSQDIQILFKFKLIVYISLYGSPVISDTV